MVFCDFYMTYKVLEICFIAPDEPQDHPNI